MDNHFGSSISGNVQSSFNSQEIQNSFKVSRSKIIQNIEFGKSNTTITGLGQDHPNYGNLAGVKIEQKINDNWSVHAQYTGSVQPFDNGQHVRNGQVGFQYRFG
ncbi:hypothetical protein pb186bvf_018794 [Paramecium bursaria]